MEWSLGASGVLTTRLAFDYTQVYRVLQRAFESSPGASPGATLGASLGVFESSLGGSHGLAPRQVQLIADRVAQHLEIISKNFDLVPGVPGFSWD